MLTQPHDRVFSDGHFLFDAFCFFIDRLISAQHCFSDVECPWHVFVLNDFFVIAFHAAVVALPENMLQFFLCHFDDFLNGREVLALFFQTAF